MPFSTDERLAAEEKLLAGKDTGVTNDIVVEVEKVVVVVINVDVLLSVSIVVDLAVFVVDLGAVDVELVASIVVGVAFDVVDKGTGLKDVVDE